MSKESKNTLIIVGSIIVVVLIATASNSSTNNQQAQSVVFQPIPPQQTEQSANTTTAPTPKAIKTVAPSETTNTPKTVAPAVTPQPTTTTPAKVTVTPTPPAVPKSWHTAFTYTDTVKATTPPFSMLGEQWRITYSCVNTNTDGTFLPNFYGYIYSTGNDKYKGAENFATAVDCSSDATPHISYAYGKSVGQYYLDINTFDSKYTVTIEDYY